MSLKGKLARLPSAGPGSKAPPIEELSRSGRVRRLQRAIDRLSKTTRRSGADALGGLLSETLTPRARDHGTATLPGESVETAHGTVHRVSHLLEPHYCHGRVAAASALDAEPDLVSELALDPTFEGLDLSRMVLIDTETTGLSIASGTLPFLIGMAYFEDQSLHVEQLMLTQLGNEAPMLRVLAERLAWASCVVSYNGKSFDWPLLRARYVMNRVETPPLPPHLDLLHCARRVFKRRLDSVRLVDMERELLGFVREHDVSGAEIPGIYLTFIRSGDPGRLDGVVEHNGHDLIALAAILGELTRRFRTVHRADDPRDHLGYARVAERAGDRERALRFSLAAVEGGGDVSCTYDASMLRARVARRAGNPVMEEEALLHALRVHPCAQVHLELSKMYEHRFKCTPRALKHAVETVPYETLEENERRVLRLQRRLARNNRRRKARRASKSA